MFEIGNTLREARLRRGLDILDCEAETKIRAKYLRAMEEEQFDLMPSATYVRGFLKSYAEFLDLDGQLVLDEYESRFGDYDATYEHSSRSRQNRRHRHRAAPAAAAPGPVAAAPPPPAAHRAPAPLAGDRRRGGRRAARLARRRLRRLAGPDPTGPRGRAAGLGAGPGARGRARHGLPGGPGAGQEDPDRADRDRQHRLLGPGARQATRRGGWSSRRILAPGQAKVFKVVDGIWVRAANPGELQVTVNGKPVELDATATANFQIGREGAEVVD